MEQKNSKSVGKMILNVVSIIVCAVLAIILIVNCILITKSFINKDKVPTLGGWYPMIVLSDSMYPEIQKGDLILGKEVEVSSLKEGDVISFFDPESKTSAVVTHRIETIENTDDGMFFTTKGDANSVKDTEKVPAGKVIGIYRSRIKGAGKVAMFMQTTPGFIVCVAAPVLIMVGVDILMKKKKKDAPEVDEEKEKLLKELEALRAEKAKREEQKASDNAD